jgi:hypothetical protein
MKKMLPLLALAFCFSCASHNQTDPTLSPTADIAMPADQLLGVAKKVVTSPPYSLAIEEENKGRLVTSFQNFQGDWHIVRYWPQRTRYTVSIARDFDHPADHSRLDVTIETQEQVAGAMVNGQPKWSHDPDNDHPERAAHLAQAIRNAAANAMTSK